MTNKIIKIAQLLFFAITILFVTTCRRYGSTQSNETIDIEKIKRDILLQVNRELVEEEAQEIKDFVESNNWEMQTTQSGLWFMIYGNGKGEKASPGKIVTIDYTLWLMDSTVCYMSNIHGQKKFIVGFGEVETGLQEGIQMMRAGEKARMILPPHLAHGMLGDGECIPRRAIVIYDLELVEVKEK